jgi:hypothetical protein
LALLIFMRRGLTFSVGSVVGSVVGSSPAISADIYISTTEYAPFKPAQRAPSPWKKDANGKWRKDDSPPPSMGPRSLPASRADHACRLVLGNMALWDSMTGEDHAMLCGLPSPHGGLFAWLESQFHDHGPLAWSTLEVDMKGQTFAPLAHKLMAGKRPASTEVTTRWRGGKGGT